MKKRLTNILFPITVFIIIINMNTAAYSTDNLFCDEWSIVGLGSVYLTSSTLKITENEIVWPGCASVPYKIITMENRTGKFLVPQLKCNGIRKDSGNGYIMVLTSQDEEYLSIKFYDAKVGITKDQELAWGEFHRIPFDKERNYFGWIGKYPITMHLEVTKAGDIEGNYYYDKNKEEIPLNGKVDGSSIILNAGDYIHGTLETFRGKYKDGKINGDWKHEGKSLKFNLVRDPWDDHYINCEEMQQYPKKVFSPNGVDLGSGSGSPNEVDYGCQGGLTSLKFTKKIYDLTEVIRSEGPQHICSGSIVHAHWRYYHYDLLKAGLAPDIYASHKEEWENDSDVNRNTLNYFKLWAHQSLYNYELYSTFWNEHKKVKPLLIKHFKDKFNLSSKKAAYYADNALSIFLGHAAGSYSSSIHGGKPDITPIDEMISKPDSTIYRLKDILKQNIQQDDLDQALKTALLYQKPQSYLELLLKKGANIDSGDESVLFFALRNHAHVNFLLKHGANVNYENSFGKTVLFYAIESSDQALVQLFLDHKADTNHSYKSKEDLETIGETTTPFYQSYCSLEHTKRTPLMHAAQHSNVAVIKILLKHGAKLDALDQKEFNAADYARMGNKPENLNYLRSLGLKENKAE